MPGIEVLVFIIAALLAGGLSIGGITLGYFLDKWREEPNNAPSRIKRAPNELTDLDRSA